ncbi:hypothetical protein GUI12_04240 [Anaplasmataceae bacterium AB001_6]|nr:hypothetical protein GUI12_04240 [Anaplasmataceae bacterium AB001_6]
MKSKILYLIGLPGSGKFTLAKMISEKYKLILIDSHKINDLILNILDNTNNLSDHIWEAIYNIRKLLIDAIKIVPNERGYIFTNVLCKDSPEDLKWYQDVVDLSKDIGFLLQPIVLYSDTQTILKRISNDDRIGTNKITDPNIFMKLFKDKEIFIPAISKKINVSNLSKEESLQKIDNIIM